MTFRVDCTSFVIMDAKDLRKLAQVHGERISDSRSCRKLVEELGWTQASPGSVLSFYQGTIFPPSPWSSVQEVSVSLWGRATG